MILKNIKINCNEDNINKAADVVKNGGIIVFPTDTVYGLGCDPYNKNAVEKIYEIKKRKKTKPLSILAFSKNEISKIAIINKIEEKIIKKFFPGKITLILKLKDKKLQRILNLRNDIAVRIPNHVYTLALLEKCKLLVGTSANISGSKLSINSKDNMKNINYDVFLDDEKTSNGRESTIIKIKNKRILIIRKGEIDKKDIEKII